VICKTRTYLEKWSLLYLIAYDVVFFIWVIDIILEHYLPYTGIEWYLNPLLYTYVVDKVADGMTLWLYIKFNLEISHVKNKLKSEDFS
jgi:hypothetical protein